MKLLWLFLAIAFTGCTHIIVLCECEKKPEPQILRKNYPAMPFVPLPNWPPDYKPNYLPFFEPKIDTMKYFKYYPVDTINVIKGTIL